MKLYCSCKGPYFPHPKDRLFNHYVCGKCLTRYSKFKDNPKYALCDQDWSINLISKMREENNPYGTFYTCKL